MGDRLNRSSRVDFSAHVPDLTAGSAVCAGSELNSAEKCCDGRVTSVMGTGTGGSHVSHMLAPWVAERRGLFSSGFTCVFRLGKPRRKKVQGLLEGRLLRKTPALTPTSRSLHPSISGFRLKARCHLLHFHSGNSNHSTERKIKIPFALKDSFRYNFTQELAAL